MMKKAKTVVSIDKLQGNSLWICGKVPDKKMWRMAAGTVILSLLAVYGILWIFTRDSLFSSAVYNSYVLQANRWLSGHLDLGRNYEYLEIACYGGRYFISFPPIPSVLLLPLCILFGENPPDHLVAVGMGLLGALFALRLALRMGIQPTAAIFWTLFLTAGSNFVHIGYRADVWYFAQVCAFGFTMMAFYFAAVGSMKSGWVPLFALALAVGCRPLNMVYLPLVLVLLWNSRRPWYDRSFIFVAAAWWWVIPALAVGVFLMVLNGVRFGNVLEFGHNYLPEFAQESPEGQFNLSYIPGNLHRMLRLPEWKDGVLEFPIFDGFAFWMLSPIMLVLAGLWLWNLRWAWKEPILWLVLGLCFLHILVLCAHKTLGGWQFGNRYTVDLLPCMFVGLVVLLRRQKELPWVIFTPLLLWGMGLNLVGTIGVMNHWLAG